MLGLTNSILSPGGRRGRLAIMIFHRVLSRPDDLLPFEPSAERFEMHMRNVRRWFHVLPLEEAVRRLADDTLPPRALAITFDDGYADNHDVAAPILRRLGMHATFFVATAYLDGGCMWNDRVIEAVRRCEGHTLDLTELGLPVVPTGTPDLRRRAIDDLLGRLKYEPTGRREELARRIVGIAGASAPSGLMMTSAQVRELADSGMGVGAHTHSHQILAGLDATAARDEIASGKQALEAILNRPVLLFAYPNGRPGKDYTPANVREVREQGFIAACSTSAGVATRGADLLQLPRFTPWDREAWKFGIRLALNLRRDRCEVV